jgi:uncharacterized protein (TIGR03437 family)
MLSFSVSGTADGRTFTFTVTNAPVTMSGTSVFSGPASLALAGGSPDTGTFSASGSLTNISAGNVTVPFTVTLGHGTLTGTMAFPETALVASGSVSASATITGGTGSYAGYTSSTLSASGTITGSVLSGGTISFSISGAVNASGGGGTPAVTGVYNTAWVAPGLPNSGIAQGAFFALVGTGLGPSTPQQVQAYPLPTSQGLGGTVVQVTVGSVTKTCIMDYVSATQVNAILPSATPTGTGTITLSYQGGTSSISVQVLAANFAMVTLNSAGTGSGVVTDLNYNVITMVNPAHPGEDLILWGSGLGAVTGDETEPPTQVDLGTGAQVFIEGQLATVLYGGRGSSPALDQIDFTVPNGISGGCKTSIAVLVKGVTGNVTSIPIAPAGQTTCGDSFGFLTAANLQKAVANGSLNMGGVVVSRIATGNDSLLGYFGNYPLNSLIRSYGGYYGPSIGSCLAYEVGGTSIETALVDPIQPTYLNAGADLTITGPGGTKTIPVSSGGYFAADLAVAPSTYIQPGSYTATNGSGGSNVTAFNWSLTLPAYVVPTNIPTTVNRAQDLTLTWTGGSGLSVASIFLISGVPVALPVSSWVFIVCDADASAGTFKVPSAILNLLPANGYGSSNPIERGVNVSIAGIPEATFTVAGSPGLDAGIFTVFVSNNTVATIQ